jgi:hypothetical protein
MDEVTKPEIILNEEDEEEFDRHKEVEEANEEPKEEAKYDSVIEESPELKQYLEYLRIKKKVESKDKLTDEEIAFIKDIEDAAQREQEIKAAQEAKAKEESDRQEKLKAEIQADYEKTKKEAPEKIVAVREKDITLTGGESIPKLLKFIFAMKKARKKGGKVLIQVFRSRKVLVKWTANDITFVEFYTTDEKGNELMEVTRFSEYPYSFEGTPIPVLFAVQGYAEGWDFFSEFRKDLSSEMVSRLITRAFHAGYLKGAEVAQPTKKKNMLEGLMAFTPIICLGGFLIIGFLVYQMYTDQTKILSMLTPENLAAAINAAGQGGQAIIDANKALIVR